MLAPIKAVHPSSPRSRAVHAHQMVLSHQLNFEYAELSAHTSASLAFALFGVSWLFVIKKGL